MNIDKYLNDGQDPKTVEKLLLKLQDMLTAGEVVTYIAVQKKPAVTLLPDSIALTSKRIFICEFTKLGLTTDFEIRSWNDIKEVGFKEEIFGAKVTISPQTGESLSINYIPKTQARKVFQLANEVLETQKGQSPLTKSPDVPLVQEVDEDERFPLQPEEEPVLKLRDALPPETEQDDELTLKLKKLKSLFERQLITQEEYENKKDELLSQL
ncbi:PH domain-containing protein [Parapedobacter deserti]|uniref:PH domain-containing protein n=1 Tax=Parapedobacter deserti TaxID=1912957 RepID=A0ABV7JIT6_9SPHI